ncbi:MAG: radical SAM protein, partial [Lachnospiraceae bacterium]|nr:radical SAM protein [Lachnospiraceae bacterium]
IRFMTSHPKDLSDELIRAMTYSEKICNHFHLPLQSGSDRILKEMNRHYDRKTYLNLVDKLRLEVPEISITTDLIVGFPGETEEDFQDTLSMVETVRYASAFTFLYSRRTGTKAASLPGQVPEDVAKERFERLLKRVQEIGQEESGKLTGKTREVLAEERNQKDPELFTGRLTDNTVVHFKSSEDVIGKIVPVKLLSSKGFYYLGVQDGIAR